MAQSTPSLLVSQASFLQQAEHDTNGCLAETQCTSHVTLHTLMSSHAVTNNVFPGPTALQG